jgi:hypothetical protein
LALDVFVYEQVAATFKPYSKLPDEESRPGERTMKALVEEVFDMAE